MALNTSVVLSCEMAAHPDEAITFSWSGNTSLITRHVDKMAASRHAMSDTRDNHLKGPGEEQRFCQSARFPSTKVEDNRETGTGVWVIIERP